MGGNTVHAYKTNPENGTLTGLQDFSPAEAGTGPRHAIITPSQSYFYLIEEEALRVEQFALDPNSGLLSPTNVSLPVTPFGKVTMYNPVKLVLIWFVIIGLNPDNATEYWGDELVLSSSGNILYASTRARNASFPGYITGWFLDSDGSLVDNNTVPFVIQTPEAGGTSNILTTSPWDDKSKDMIILTDQDTGFVALYEMQDLNLVLLDRVK